MSRLSLILIWVLTCAVLGMMGAITLVVAGVASIWLILVLPLVVIAETGVFRMVRSGFLGLARRAKGH